MAFNRVRRRLSTLGTSSKNRKARATTETRSYSGSTNDNTYFRDENSVEGLNNHPEVIESDKLLTSDEAREALALAPKQNTHSVSAVYSEPARGEFRGHKDRSVPANVTERFPSSPAEPAPSLQVGSTVPIKFPSTATLSRRTAIYVGKPEQIASERQQKERPSDEARQKAEQNYYETTEKAGRSRRRSMLRSVSKDDYLLARGANPRTGIVTPGIHSASSSWEEVELLKQKGILLPSKWRQRGDQWVSLDMGEPTPLPTPPQGPRTHQAGRPRRTPPRLTPGEFNHNSGPRSGHQNPSVPAALFEDVPTPDGIPGKFPISPLRETTGLSAISRPAHRPIVKRKPVGSPAKDDKNDPASIQDIPQDGADTVLRHLFVTQPRSSSAPAARVAEFESPDDVGKSLGKGIPSVPNPSTRGNNLNSQRIEIQEPFLGRKPPGQVKVVPESKTSAPSRSEKELPCLPTSNGQYQSQASNQGFPIKPQTDRSRDGGALKLMGPRGGDPAYPYVRNMRMTIPPRQCHITPSVSTARNIDSSMMSIPTYDNPPSQMQMLPRQMRGVIGGPRPMEQPRSISENLGKADKIFTSAPATMSMNTRIPTHISTLQPRLQGRSHRMALGFEVNTESEMYQYRQERIYPNDSRQRNMNMSSNAPMRLPQGRPRAYSRPPLLDRADAHIRSVPRMSPQRNKQMDYMENQHPWRMTGTSESANSEKSDVSAASTTGSEIDLNLMPSPLRPTVIETDEVAPESSRKHESRSRAQTEVRVSDNRQEDPLSQSSGLTRACSRCHSGFVAGSLRSTGGRSQMSRSNPVTEEEQELSNANHQHLRHEDNATVTKSTAVPKSESTDEVDERDHTACCTECCTKEDCHEGCLGHPSPSIRSFDGSTIIDSDEGLSTPERSSPSISACPRTASSLLKTKLSFIQGLRIRKTLRTRQSPDDGKTIKERYSALDSPPIELDSHPLSPGTFWRGGGAVAAAKRALGAKNAAFSLNASVKEAKRTTSVPRLVIPKIRELRSHNGSEADSWKSARPGTRNTSEASSATAVSSAPRSRNASGQSMLSIEVPHIISNLGTINPAGLLEMLRVPFEAAAMWIQTHPDVQQRLGKGVEMAMEMARTVVETGGTIWEVSYVYSKTGRMRCKASSGVGALVMDCGRSVGYLLVFAAVGVCLGRVLGFVLGLFQGVFCVLRAVGWVLKKLGLGVL
jgi:hypothetical protein